MKMWLLLLIAGCGDATPPPSRPAPPPPSTQVTAEKVCRRIDELKRERCGAFEVVFPFGYEGCLRGYNASTKDPAVEALGHCFVAQKTCDDVLACTNRLTAALKSPTNLRACAAQDAAEPTRAVGIPRADWDRRHGSGVTSFRVAASSPATPIETCGIDEAHVWLASAACDGGVRPITNAAGAELARVGGVGAGGRCGSPVSHYRVSCPERRYDVFFDTFLCPR